MFLTPLSAVPYLGICTGLLSARNWSLRALPANHSRQSGQWFGWGTAIGSVLLPGLVIVPALCVHCWSKPGYIGSKIAEIFSPDPTGNYTIDLWV